MKQPLNQSFLAANNADASLKRVSLNIKQPPRLCIYTMELLLNANALRAVQQRMRISEDNLMAEDKNVECRFFQSVMIVYLMELMLYVIWHLNWDWRVIGLYSQYL